jgi:hypothetical protein
VVRVVVVVELRPARGTYPQQPIARSGRTLRASSTQP